MIHKPSLIFQESNPEAVFTALIEFGLIMVLYLGDFLGNDSLMTYAK